MNYELELGVSKPYVFNTLNGGYPPLVSGSGSSSRLTGNTDTAFQAYNKGYEDIPFTLEVWYQPLTNTGEHTVIGHSNGEGVLWNGSRFILRVKLGDGTQIVEGTYRPNEIKAFHVVMTYSNGQAFLYIDGELAVALGIPDALFFATGQGIRINGGTSSGLYDSLALYYRTLSVSEIKQHYAWGNDVLDATAITMLKGGSTWSLSYEDVELLDRFVYDPSNFNQGYIDNVSAPVDSLIASSSAGGTWRQSIALGSLTDGPSYGVHLTYEGEGVTLSYSTDGSTWTPVANKTTVIQDTTLTDGMLLIQLVLADDTSWVSWLRVDVLRNRTMLPLSGNRILNFSSVAMDQTPGNQLDYQLDRGGDFRTGGQIIIDPDSGVSPQNVGTVEMWFKCPTSAGVPTLLDGQVGGTGYGWISLSNMSFVPNGGTAYINGVATGTTTLQPGVWYHLVFVQSTAANMSVFIGRPRAGGNTNNLTIGHLSVYSQQMTASQAAALYNLNVGAPSLRVDDTSGVTVSENTPTVNIYAKSWSYVSSGR